MKAIATALANSTLGLSIRQLPPKARLRLLVLVLVLALLSCLLGVYTAPKSTTYDGLRAATEQAAPVAPSHAARAPVAL